MLESSCLYTRGMQRLTDLQQKSLELGSIDEASVLGLETSMSSFDLICSEAETQQGTILLLQLCFLQVNVAKFHHLKSLLIR